MGMRKLEASILREAKEITKNSKLTQKNIMEWSTSEEQVKKNLRPNEGEKMFKLPSLCIWIAVKEK